MSNILNRSPIRKDNDMALAVIEGQDATGNHPEPGSYLF
jgi:hypothetical protein